MKNLLAVLISVAFALPSSTYYVDPILGNDANSGLSKYSPWQSVSKVASSQLQPGDTVLFRRGTSFEITQTFLMNSEGVTYGAYASGERPIIECINEIALAKKQTLDS